MSVTSETKVIDTVNKSLRGSNVKNQVITTDRRVEDHLRKKPGDHHRQ